MKDLICTDTQLISCSELGTEIINYLNNLTPEIIDFNNTQNERSNKLWNKGVIYCFGNLIFKIKCCSFQNNYKIYLAEFSGLEICVLFNPKINRFIFLHGSRYYLITDNFERVHQNNYLRNWKRGGLFINFYDKFTENLTPRKEKKIKLIIKDIKPAETQPVENAKPVNKLLQINLGI